MKKAITQFSCEEAPEGEIHRRDLHPGDWLRVTTVNSDYLITPASSDTFYVSGGWFDRERLSPFCTTINGCTWGGSVIKTNTIAACGLRLEFGNTVVTSPIQGFRVFRCPSATVI